MQLISPICCLYSNKSNAVFPLGHRKITEFQTANISKEIGRVVSNHDWLKALFVKNNFPPIFLKNMQRAVFAFKNGKNYCSEIMAKGQILNGAPEEIRTPDPQIRSLVLYPAELRVHF